MSGSGYFVGEVYVLCSVSGSQVLERGGSQDSHVFFVGSKNAVSGYKHCLLQVDTCVSSFSFFSSFLTLLRVRQPSSYGFLRGKRHQNPLLLWSIHMAVVHRVQTW